MKTKNKKKKFEIYLLFSLPCGGKGTHGSILSEVTGLPHINMGDEMRRRKELTGPGRLKDVYMEAMDAGRLMPDGFAIRTWKELRRATKSEHGYIFDGFPRTNGQVDAFMQYLDALRRKRGDEIEVVLRIVIIHITACESKRRMSIVERGREEDKKKSVQKTRIEEYGSKTSTGIFRLFSEAKDGEPIKIDGSGSKIDTMKALFKALDIDLPEEIIEREEQIIAQKATKKN